MSIRCLVRGRVADLECERFLNQLKALARTQPCLQRSEASFKKRAAQPRRTGLVQWPARGTGLSLRSPSIKFPDQPDSALAKRSLPRISIRYLRYVRCAGAPPFSLPDAQFTVATYRVTCPARAGLPAFEHGSRSSSASRPIPDARYGRCSSRVPPDPLNQPPVFPLLPSSHLDQTHRLLTVCHVPPFSDRCRHLLWRLLTSDDPSRYLTAPVAAKQQIGQTSQGKTRDLPTYTRRIYSNTFRASIGLRRILPPHPCHCLVCDSCSSISVLP